MAGKIKLFENEFLYTSLLSCSLGNSTKSLGLRETKELFLALIKDKTGFKAIDLVRILIHQAASPINMEQVSELPNLRKKLMTALIHDFVQDTVPQDVGLFTRFESLHFC